MSKFGYTEIGKLCVYYYRLYTRVLAYLHFMSISTDVLRTVAWKFEAWQVNSVCTSTLDKLSIVILAYVETEFLLRSLIWLSPISEIGLLPLYGLVEKKLESWPSGWWDFIDGQDSLLEGNGRPLRYHITRGKGLPAIR